MIEYLRNWSMSKYSSLVLFLLKSLLSLLALALLTVIIHEDAHLVAALIMRVPILSFTWFDLRYFAPVFVSGAKEYTLPATVVSYSGGLVTGLLLLVILTLKRGWFKQSLYRWLLGLYIATVGFWHLSQGILEGAFHDMYIAGAANIFSLSNCVGYAFGVLGLALYLAFMPGIKSLIAREV
jgi:hypothetical protein